MRIAAAVAALLLASGTSKASIILEASAGPDLVASGHSSVTFELAAPTVAHLDLVPSVNQQQNEEFGCASYPDETARCEGVFGASLTLSLAGETNPILFRGLSTTFTHGVNGVVISGDEFGCAFAAQGCQALLIAGTYTFTVDVDLSIMGRNGAIPAPVLRSIAGELRLDAGDTSSAPEPASSILICSAAAVGLAVRFRARR